MWHEWERRGTCIGYLRKPEGKRPLRRPRRRWIHNIKMDLLVIGFGIVDWIGLAQVLRNVVSYKGNTASYP
jgi:hypothetical protein